MKEEDLHRVESELGVLLPNSYRQVIISDPFTEYKTDCHIGLIDNPDDIIATNVGLRAHGFNGMPWKKNYLAFDSDGMGFYYFIDLNIEDSPVYVASDEEYGSIEADSLTDWVEQQKDRFEYEKEKLVQEGQERRSKKWWQFWL